MGATKQLDCGALDIVARERFGMLIGIGSLAHVGRVGQQFRMTDIGTATHWAACVWHDWHWGIDAG